MSLKKIIVLVLTAIGVCWLWMQYGLIVMLYLTTPPVRELTTREKTFTDSLQRICKCKEISRAPEHKTNSNGKYRKEYGIFFSGIPDYYLKNKDSLKSIAFKIAKESYLNVNRRSSEFDIYVVGFDSENDYLSSRFYIKELY